MDGSRDRIYLIINGNSQFTILYPLNNVVLMVAELLRRYVRSPRVMAAELAIFKNQKLQNYVFLFNCNILQ